MSFLDVPAKKYHKNIVWVAGGNHVRFNTLSRTHREILLWYDDRVRESMRWNQDIKKLMCDFCLSSTAVEDGTGIYGVAFGLIVARFHLA